MEDNNYSELIYQELMDIKEDTNSINGELTEYFYQLTYTPSGDKYYNYFIEGQNQIIIGITFILLLLITILFYLFYHHIFNSKR